MLLPTKLHLQQFLHRPPSQGVCKDTTRLKQVWIPGDRARRNMSDKMLRSTMFSAQNSPTHFACRVLGHLDWAHPSQQLTSGHKSPGPRILPRPLKEILGQKRRWPYSRQQQSRVTFRPHARRYCTFQSWDVLPVGHPRFVERHEVDLARGPTLGAGEEYLEMKD